MKFSIESKQDKCLHTNEFLLKKTIGEREQPIQSGLLPVIPGTLSIPRNNRKQDLKLGVRYD
jgi:hypothetical protein